MRPTLQQLVPSEKEKAVQGMFSSIAHRYDLNNSLLSLGWHHAWKRKAIQMANIQEGMAVLDLCTGTADLTILLAQAISPHRPPHIKIIALDLNEQMLSVGREKIAEYGLSRQVICLRGHAEWLQFKDHTFDVVTVAFGIRNVDHVPKAFAEIYRVLKPEGKMICLEFTRPPSRLLRRLYDFYSFKILPFIGTAVAGDKTGVYQYLPSSIREFPDQEGLKAIIQAAGFRKVEYLNLTGGIVAIHRGFKAR
ncbi:MAG: bifunctional demethylmenaquinone methyltransferase/2-methoxy-6-polyprenyl-1,4-benzoquinol methylase UbiE [Nitrospira sp.]|nr:bifunctional demethylmenaquinone methyltransferase/2-methoxy-6-polyprenyl-1,4-benzoquinol methylase UbiE [Nitrospira sp.]